MMLGLAVAGAGVGEAVVLGVVGELTPDPPHATPKKPIKRASTRFLPGFTGGIVTHQHHPLYYKPYFVLSGDGKLDRRNTEVPGFTRWQKTKLWLGQRSEVWNGIRSRRSPIPWVNNALNSFQVATPMHPPGPALPITAALIVAMRRQAAQLGSEFMVLNTGYRGERIELHQKLRLLLRRKNVRLLGIEGNLDEARKRDPKGLWDFPNDIHWNVAAHDLVAQITFNFLKASGLLGERSLRQ